ncbi:glucose PTS transporter subunit IIA [Paramicrobacterium sp. CJ85]|uniref:glucose PTS transporter subunit IIA n=1 Tax=Paramicrobacterium sp. CJ85 TaxID=3445355 RepID=UPI003F5DA713
MSNTRTLADDVGVAIGGPRNVTWVGACTTRLRFVVRDESQVDFGALEKTPGVLKAVSAGGQVQVVIGTQVGQVREALLSQKHWANLADQGNETSGGRRRPLDVVFDFLGGTFQPLIPVITGAAMVQVLTLLLTQFAGLNPEEPTALILTATGNAIFYFLPLFVAFTASKKLGANPYIGAAIAASLLHPSFVAIGDTGTVAQAFGLPLFVYSYASSMFPALLLALALAGLERLLKRWLPQTLQQVFIPTIELVLLVPLTALVFGPIGVLVGNGIGAGTQWLATTAPFVFYIVVPALWFLLVAFGVHWALISIALADVAATGSSVILGAAVGYQYAVMGIALAMLIRTIRSRDASLRGTASAATIAVTIGGITEPTIYGFLLRYRRLLLIEIISAAASGAVLGLFNAKMLGFSPAPFLGMPLMQPMTGAALALLVGVAVPIVLVQIWGFEKKLAGTESEPSNDRAKGGEQSDDAEPSASPVVEVLAPIAGRAVALSESGEAVFGAGVLGPGVCVIPDEPRVVAPIDGTIIAMPTSGHAVGLVSDDGAEVLVHVGIDTVKLRGKHFTPRAEQGQRVRAGDVLIEFDRSALLSQGISVVTPIVVTNADETGRAVEVLAEGHVREGDPLLSISTRVTRDA